MRWFKVADGAFVNDWATHRIVKLETNSASHPEWILCSIDGEHLETFTFLREAKQHVERLVAAPEGRNILNRLNEICSQLSDLAVRAERLEEIA